MAKNNGKSGIKEDKQMEKSNTHKKKDLMKSRFLEELRSEEVGGNITIALRRLGFHRSTLYDWKATDIEFADAWEIAVVDGKEAMADEAEHALRKQILNGNVTAIIFSLKNLRHEQWEDREVKEHRGKIRLDKLTDDEIVKHAKTIGVIIKSNDSTDSSAEEEASSGNTA